MEIVNWVVAQVAAELKGGFEDEGQDVLENKTENLGPRISPGEGH